MGCKESTLSSHRGMGNNSSNETSGGGGSQTKKGGSKNSGEATSQEKSSIIGGRTSDRGDEIIFGTGVHVGRAGNVDLSGRKMDFLGTNIVDMINDDELHRKATSLTLSNNVLYILGKELSFLPDLEEIEMDSNKFTRLPEALTKLPKLWRIDASLNPLDPIRGFDIAPRLTSLRSLTLRDCNFTAFPVRILEISTLEELNISDNPNMDLHDVAISNLSRIKTLNVANCGLSGRALPACIRRATGIVSLDISNNQFDFFGDVSMEFFGKSIPQTLKELHLRGMQLTSVPPFVANLKKLHSLDLAMNPIETLDVLAGRFVKRIPRTASAGSMGHGYGTSSPQSYPKPKLDSPQTATAKRDGLPPRVSSAGNTADDGDDAASTTSDGKVSTSSRISMSLVSKAGMIAPVSHPIPLKKLSLRACGLRTVPKYFHKMTQIEELDLSENDQLDDPNMTLFSLQNLKVLNIIGCPFAEDPSKSRNEWFDIAKLRKLRDIQWELWKGNHNMSPYRTKIPIEICGLSLRRINLVQLRRDLFVGRTVETVINLLRDGYFKVDLAVDDNTLWSHVEAIRVFASGEKFFFPEDIRIRPPAAESKPVPAAKPTGDMLIHGKELGRTHLHIAINRYIFFLAMQAANYDAVIIPPLDVMIIHYSQITCHPVKYRADCEAICGRILNCNYRAFFLEQQRYPQAAKDAVAASKKIWNLMVRSAQTDLAWLRYDFWDKRARNTHTDPSSAATGAARGSNAGGSTGTTNPNAARSQALPSGPLGATDNELYADFSELSRIDSTHDLAGVLDQAITAHFMEQGDEVFRDTLTDFFKYNNCYLLHQHSLAKLTLDWTRYVKYLALYAYRIAMSYQSDSTVIMEPIADGDGNLFTPGGPTKRSTSLLGKHYDTMNNSSFAGPGKYLPVPTQQTNPYEEEAAERRASGIARRSSSGLSTASRVAQKQKDTARRFTIQSLTVNPIPTIGISLLLHAHRTTHVKYFQTLSLLGIEDVDVTWEETDNVVEQTEKAWEAVYDEAYIGSTMEYTYRCMDGLISPMLPRADGNASSRVFAPERNRSPSDRAEPATYVATLKPKKSILLRRGTREARLDRTVSLCCGDTENGVF